MKTLLVLLLVSSMSTVAYADELCGLLQSKMVAPVCAPGTICPALRTIVYTITPSGGAEVTISTSDLATFQNIEALDGTSVCVEGTAVDGGFEVASIKTE